MGNDEEAWKLINRGLPLENAIGDIEGVRNC